MKIVHVSTTDYGGAYKAAARISGSLQRCGEESSIMIRTKRYQDTAGSEVFHNGYQRLFSKIKNGFNILLSRGEVISDYFGTDITHYQMVKEADVIVLHWVNSFISYRVVEQLTKLGKPIIWVMHDMWLLTGGCHVDQYCGGYEHLCGKCPLIGSRKKKDLSYRNFIRKKKMLQGSKIRLVCPSRWLSGCAAHSEITKGQSICRIPNPIDINLYKPLEKTEDIRDKYHISADKKVILYGAVNATSDQNKGYQHLLNALKLLDGGNYVLVIYGNSEGAKGIEKYISTILAGYIQDEQTLIELYNLADVFVAPSLQENYPNSVLEASACGTPVTAFQIGGMPDIVLHNRSGYLAPLGDAGRLAEGIKLCAQNSREMGACARKHVEETNSYERIGKSYQELILDMMEQA